MRGFGEAEKFFFFFFPMLPGVLLLLPVFSVPPTAPAQQQSLLERGETEARGGMWHLGMAGQHLDHPVCHGVMPLPVFSPHLAHQEGFVDVGALQFYVG